MSNVAVRIDKVSKKYRRYASVGDGIKEFFHPLRKRYHHEFWALKDISLGIERGESVGIMGRNGSGKSTLLQIICGVLRPTAGNVTVHGRVAALLELGAGFHPLFTGRENVAIGGAMMGLRSSEIAERFGAIERFADIGDFIDQPVRTYSSGMFLRLAFATAVHVNPEILVIDEVLAVGDFAFRQKCAEKINELRKNTTVIIVSHSARDILTLCKNAAVMDRGEMVFFGAAEEAVRVYADLAGAPTFAAAVSEDIRLRVRAGMYSEIFHNSAKIEAPVLRWTSAGGEATAEIACGDDLSLDFSFQALAAADTLILGLVIYTLDGRLISGLSTEHQKLICSIRGAEHVHGSLRISNVLNPGDYVAMFVILDGKEFLYRGLAGRFTVKPMPVAVGCVTLAHEWTLNIPART